MIEFQALLSFSVGVGVAVLNVIDSVVETLGNVEKNKTQAKRQGLHGTEGSASVATGFVVDAAKATVKGVASTAAATAGAVAVGALFSTGAPVLLTGAVAIFAAYETGRQIDSMDKKYKITDSLKREGNQLINGISNFTRGMKGG